MFSNLKIHPFYSIKNLKQRKHKVHQWTEIKSWMQMKLSVHGQFFFFTPHICSSMRGKIKGKIERKKKELTSYTWRRSSISLFIFQWMVTPSPTIIHCIIWFFRFKEFYNGQNNLPTIFRADLVPKLFRHHHQCIGTRDRWILIPPAPATLFYHTAPPLTIMFCVVPDDFHTSRLLISFQKEIEEK